MFKLPPGLTRSVNSSEDTTFFSLLSTIRLFTHHRTALHEYKKKTLFICVLFWPFSTIFCSLFLSSYLAHSLWLFIPCLFLPPVLSRFICIKWNNRSDFHRQATGLRDKFQLCSEGRSRLHESGVLQPPSSLQKWVPCLSNKPQEAVVYSDFRTAPFCIVPNNTP